MRISFNQTEKAFITVPTLRMRGATSGRSYHPAVVGFLMVTGPNLDPHRGTPEIARICRPIIQLASQDLWSKVDKPFPAADAPACFAYLSHQTSRNHEQYCLDDQALTGAQRLSSVIRFAKVGI